MHFICNQVVTVGAGVRFLMGQVTCSDREELRRLMARNSFSEEEASARIRSQMPLAMKAKRSDVVVDNNGSKGDLEAAAVKAYLDITARRSYTPNLSSIILALPLAATVSIVRMIASKL